MFYSLRHIAPESKFAHALHLDVFEQIIPAALIRDVLTETQSWEEREKALNMAMVIVTIIAMGLFASASMQGFLVYPKSSKNEPFLAILGKFLNTSKKARNGIHVP